MNAIKEADANEPIVYVGSNKVTPVQLENGLISVTLEGNVELKMTPEQFDQVKSPTPYEDGWISIRKWRMTVAKILTILTQDNLEMNDRDFVMQRVDESILNNFRAASAKLFGVDTTEHVTLSMIGNIVNPVSEKNVS